MSLTFKLGEFVSISGVSGSGKTTLIKMIGAMDRFQNGEIFVEYNPLSHLDEVEFEQYRRDRVSFIFQDYALLEQYSVYENLKLVLLGRNLDSKEINRRIDSILKDANMTAFKERKVNRLSGGQKQKVAVMRAILKDTSIIIGDEITANLDSRSSREVIELLYLHSEGKLVLLVTHHEEELLPYATRKIVMKEGRIIEDLKLKKVEEVYTLKENVFTQLSINNKFYLSLKSIRRNFSSILAVVMMLIAIFASAVGLSLGYEYFNSLNSYYPMETSWILNRNENRLIIEKSDRSNFSEDELQRISNYNEVDFVVDDSVSLDTYIYSSEKYVPYILHSMHEKNTN